MLKGDMETALYFAVVAHGDIMQGAEEEGLLASDGFLVAIATLEHVEQKVSRHKGLMLLLIACLH
jgi:hypothetical protein